MKLFIENLILIIILFLVSISLFKSAIILIKKMQFGQIVREDGPTTHLIKSGTPTMGGIVFIIIFFISSIFLYFYKNNLSDIFYKIVLFMILFGLIGFIDDFLKITKKNTKGLKEIYKFILQILFSIFALIICFHFNFFNNIFLFLFLVFIIVGTDNGVNFTDGLDGLCSFITIIISIFYLILSIQIENIDLIIINLIMIVVLISFLLFNHYPAKLFMGDTGSLFLGAYISLMAIALDLQFFLPIFGFIYMIEVISVIMQVSYFKITHGKRIFKMAPIHHHYEKLGMSEQKIVLMFSLCTIIMCIITYILMEIL